MFPPDAGARVRWKLICGSEPCDIALRYDKEALRKAALRRIEHSIHHYERALELKPDVLVKLGLAWALDVHGQAQRAMNLYREIIAGTWPSERDEKWSIMGDGAPFNYGDVFDADAAGFNGHLSRFVTYEAAFYLSALLDPATDRHELDDLRAKMVQLARNGTGNAGITPIVIPMDRHSPLSALADATRYVRFDLDGLGARKWQWLTSRAGLLVFVGDESRPDIVSGHQLFGNVTFRNFWRSGYEALASLDDDSDGWLRADELKGVAVWNDRDRDGRSGEAEILPLSMLGIVGLAVAHGDTQANVLLNRRGVEYENGAFGPSYDWVSYPEPAVLN